MNRGVALVGDFSVQATDTDFMGLCMNVCLSLSGRFGHFVLPILWSVHFLTSEANASFGRRSVFHDIQAIAYCTTSHPKSLLQLQ